MSDVDIICVFVLLLVAWCARLESRIDNVRAAAGSSPSDGPGADRGATDPLEPATFGAGGRPQHGGGE